MKNKATLSIMVFDTIKVSDAYKQKTFKKVIQKVALPVYIDFDIELLIAGIKRFARPPTFGFSFNKLINYAF